MTRRWRISIRAVAIVAICLVVLVVMAGSASAITGNYSVKDFEHPFVGLVVIYNADGDFLWRGSGSLISPTVFLTAGHVADTVGGAASARVYFQQDAGFNYDPDLEFDPITLYPVGDSPDGLSRTSHEIHNFGYTGSLTVPETHDVGLLVLDTPIEMAEYGELPAPGALDALATKRGVQNETFTVSGYGLIKSVQPQSALSNISERSRLMAQETLVTLTSAFTDGYNVALQGSGKDRGGTAFGDSGGPAFLGGPTSNVIVGVTSFGMNQMCAGVGWEYRIDRQPVLDWINSYLH